MNPEKIIDLTNEQMGDEVPVSSSEQPVIDLTNEKDPEVIKVEVRRVERKGEDESAEEKHINNLWG